MDCTLRLMAFEPAAGMVYRENALVLTVEVHVEVQDEVLSGPTVRLTCTGVFMTYGAARAWPAPTAAVAAPTVTTNAAAGSRCQRHAADTEGCNFLGAAA